MREGTGPSMDENGIRDRFQRVLERDLAGTDQPCTQGPWIVGFSHGADSSALLLLLHDYSQTHRVPPLHPIHVDHGLRPESASEAERALGFCEQLGMPCEIHRLGQGQGESWARQARYGIFSARARALGASRLWLAHHRDDDLETLLFRLLRGTGPLGLAGIPAQRPLDGVGGLLRCGLGGGLERQAVDIHRPLLRFSKQELVDLLRDHQRTWIEDPSNALLDLTPRNRIRHELIPRLQESPRAWTALLALKHEAELFSTRVHEEIQDLPLAPDLEQDGALPLRPLQELSPWAFERYLSLVLEGQGQDRPSRALLRQARLLLRDPLPSGKRVESRGRWSLERRKMALHLRLLASSLVPPNVSPSRKTQ